MERGTPCEALLARRRVYCTLEGHRSLPCTGTAVPRRHLHPLHRLLVHLSLVLVAAAHATSSAAATPSAPSAPSDAAPAAPAFRIMNFNVLEGGGGPPPPPPSSSSSPASPRFLRVETIVRDHLVASRLTGDVCVVVFNELNGWSNASFAAWAANLGFTFSAFARSPHGYHLGLAAAGYEEADGRADGRTDGRADARADATRPDGQAGAQAGAQASDRATLVEAVNGGAGSGTPFHHGLIWATVAGVDIIGTHLSPHSSEARLRETTAIVERLEMARATRRGRRRGRERERGAKKGEAGGGRLDEVAVEVGVDAATGATTAVGRRRAGRLGTGGSGDDALAIIVGDLNTLSPLDAARFVERRPGEDEASSNASLLLDALRRTHRLRLKFLRPPPQVTDSTRGTSEASAASAASAAARPLSHGSPSVFMTGLPSTSILSP